MDKCRIPKPSERKKIEAVSQAMELVTDASIIRW